MNQLYKLVKMFSVLLLLAGVSSNAFGQCAYIINLNDSFGDGWNGAVLTVTQNGVSTEYTIADGTFFTDTFTVQIGTPLVFEYAAGTFEGEVTYEVIDNTGSVIFSDGPFPATGEVFSIVPTCSNCGIIGSVEIGEITGVGADFLIADADSAASFFIVNVGQADDYDNTVTTQEFSTTNITIDGLVENTEYQAYFGTVCDNGDTSSFVGPINFTTLFANDVGIAEVTGPIGICNMGEDTVTFILAGYGSELQTLFHFGFSVNGEVVSLPIFDDGFFTGIVGSEDSVAVSFDTGYDFSAPGLYEIAVWTALENDGNTANDTAYYSLYSIPVIDNLPYAANFTANAEGWSVSDESENNSWAFGAPENVLISSANSGTNAWVTNLTGDYNNGERSFLESVCYDFSNIAETPIFSLNINFDTETNWDGAWLEGSVDGGVTWNKVGAIGAGTNWYNNNITNNGDLGDVWSGNSDGWLYAEHPLDDYTGEPDCRFRFGFDSDGSVSNEGVAIDDIRIYIPLANDMQASSVTNTDDSECGTAMDNIEFTFRNSGFEPQTDFIAYYQVNNETPVMEAIDALTLAPGENYTHTFATPFNSFGIGSSFDIKAWVENDGDQDINNDTTTYAFVSGAPQSLPFSTDFEMGLPGGWQTDGIIGEGHNSGSNVLYRNLWNAVPDFTTTTTNYVLDDEVQDMTFDYRITDYSAGTVGTPITQLDSLIVEISPACEDSFTPIYTVDSMSHFVTAEYINVTIDLTDYADQVVKFRFRGVWGAGDYYLDIDNININTDMMVNANTLETEEFTYKMYPNPTAVATRLEASFEAPANATIFVANALGQVVYQKYLGNTVQVQEDIHTANWAPGIYFVNMTVNGQHYTQRLIKQ